MALWAGAAALLLASGCRSPDTKFYALPTPPATDVSRTDGPGVVVAMPEVPRLVDRAQLVWRTGATRVQADDFNRWAASFPAEIQRGLVENLRLELRTEAVVAEPAEAPAGDVVRLAVAIQQLDAQIGDSVVLRAVYSLRRGDEREAAARDVAQVRVNLKGEEPRDVVVAYGAAVTELARKIAERIGRLPPPRASDPAPAPPAPPG